MHTINQVCLSQINERLSVIILNEHQRHILPLIASKMDAIKIQIHNDVEQQLLVCDQLLKDNIIKMCTSKVVSNFRCKYDILYKCKIFFFLHFRKLWNNLVMQF